MTHGYAELEPPCPPETLGASEGTVHVLEEVPEPGFPWTCPPKIVYLALRHVPWTEETVIGKAPAPGVDLVHPLVPAFPAKDVDSPPVDVNSPNGNECYYVYTIVGEAGMPVEEVVAK